MCGCTHAAESSWRAKDKQWEWVLLPSTLGIPGIKSRDLYPMNHTSNTIFTLKNIYFCFCVCACARLSVCDHMCAGPWEGRRGC